VQIGAAVMHLISRLCLILCTFFLVVVFVGCAGKSGPEAQQDLGLSADQRVIEHTVGSGESLSRIADNYYGDPARSEDIARQNGLSDPERMVAGSVLRLQFSADEWDAALRRASALKAYNKGVDLMANDRVGEAEKQFKLALDTAPDLLAAKYNLALAHLKRGRNDRALVLLSELTAERPTDPEFLFARGNALFQGTEFAAAIVQFSAALEYRPGFKRAAFGLARSYQENGQAEQAIIAWQAYLALDSSSSWAATAERNLRILTKESDEVGR